jgi:hypothetical protein
VGEPVPEIPRYTVIGKLGRGGMGVVYQARQLQLNRLVALKMILAGSHADEQDLARFRREAEAVARLQHPNVVQIYEVGEHNGLPYLALEFCSGGSLDKKLKGGPLSFPEAAHLVEVLARAMHAAHQQQIVHRDLKPANVLLTADGTPKITDFGLAKCLDDSAGYTPSNAALGTPSYMAPEQAGGRGKTISLAADVYALGAILYELLTGRPPFQAATDLDTILQVVSDEPVPPRQLQPQVPRDLETICLKCLQKEPGQRYESAEALAGDLRRFLEGRPIRARPVGRLPRVVKWAKRAPALATLLGVLLVVLGTSLFVLAGFIAWVGQERRNNPSAIDSKGEVVQAVRRAYGLAFSPDDRFLAASDRSGTVTLRNPQTGQVVHTLRGHAQTVTSIAFDSTGERLASASNDGTVKIWDVASHTVIHTLKGHQDQVTSVAFSPNGQHLASGSEDRKAKVWDVKEGKELLTFSGHRGKIHCVAFSPTGKHVASGNGALAVGVVKVWDGETGKELFPELRHKGPVWSVAFRRDGRWLASAGGDQTVKVWDADTGKMVHDLRHAYAVNAVAFSPDGAQLVSSSGLAVQVWRIHDGARVLELPMQAAEIANAVFSSDGRRLASIAIDGTVKVWDATSGREINPP